MPGDRVRTIHVLPSALSEGGPVTPVDPSQREDVKKIVRLLTRLVERGYYGKLTICLQNGRITLAQTEQTLKIDEL